MVAFATAGRLRGHQAAWRHWPVQGTARPHSAGWGRPDLGGPTSVQGNHPRRWDQHALAGVGMVDPAVRPKCDGPGPRKGFSIHCLPWWVGAGSGGFNQERAKTIMEDELGKMDYPLEVRLVVFKKG